MSRWLVIGLLVGLVVGQGVEASAAEPPEPLTFDQLAERPKVREVLLAPSGDRLAALLRENHGSSLWILDPTAGAPRKLCDTRRVEGLHWSTDGTRLVLETAERLGVVPVTGGRPSWIVELDAEREQAFAEVDPVMPRHLLITEKLADDRRRLLRVDEHGDTTTLFESTSPISDYLLDDDGEILFVKVLNGDTQVIEQVIERGIEQGDDNERRTILRCPVLDPCGLVAFDGERLLMRTRRDGERFDHDRWHLVAVDIEDGRARAIHGDPKGSPTSVGWSSARPTVNR